MRVIGVIDLMGGQVVRGIGGQRHRYRPVHSLLAPGTSPIEIGRAFIDKLNLRRAYVADLDAIAGHEPDWPAYRDLLHCGLDLWVDAGIDGIERARALVSFEHRGRAISGIVIGLESLAALHQLGAILDLVGPRRLIFSLDLKAGHPLVRDPGWRGRGADAIASEAVRAGVRRMIVLDLAGVGMEQGVRALDLCRRLRRDYPAIELISGGGVRGPDDLALLAASGCDAALVASALHDGRITAAHLSPES